MINAILYSEQYLTFIAMDSGRKGIQLFKRVSSFLSLKKFYVKPYETYSAVKRSNAVLCKRMRSATDKSKIDNGCMQKHKREKKAALFLQ